MTKKESGKGLSRRDLIKTAAVGAGALAIAGLGHGISFSATPPKKWDKETDVVVIGYGAAGAAAAIAAHDAGAKVMILEKSPAFGGASRVSGGIIYAADTAIQKEQGISDSPDAMVKYFNASNRGLMDQEILKTMAYDSSGIINWLISLGIKNYTLQIAGAEDTPEFAAITPPKKRGHIVKGLGKEMMSLLEKAVNQRKITVSLSSEVKELVSSPARNIMGVSVKSGSEKPKFIKAKKGVVICSGGYNFNKALVRSFAAMFTDAVPVGSPTSDGSGMIIGGAEGAALTAFGGPELAVGLPGLVYGPNKSRHIRALFLYDHPVVFVDEQGRRFANESSYYAHLTPIVARQRKAFMIFDEETYKKTAWPDYVVGSSQGLKKEMESGVIKKAENFNELARLIGINPDAFQTTMNTYNKFAAEGKDPEFGKFKALGLVKTPPFYAGNVGATTLHCYGGLKINNKAQVIDVFGKVIPRLYAAGATTGTVYTYPGSGTLLNTCFVFGRIAGKGVAAEKSRK